ncbi:hypothetical protein MRX96_048609 [Rhipicephalus microplus]
MCERRDHRKPKIVNRRRRPTDAERLPPRSLEENEKENTKQGQCDVVRRSYGHRYLETAAITTVKAAGTEPREGTNGKLHASVSADRRKPNPSEALFLSACPRVLGTHLSFSVRLLRVRRRVNSRAQQIDTATLSTSCKSRNEKHTVVYFDDRLTEGIHVFHDDAADAAFRAVASVESVRTLSQPSRLACSVRRLRVVFATPSSLLATVRNPPDQHDDLSQEFFAHQPHHNRARRQLPSDFSQLAYPEYQGARRWYT